jgi:[glutamine synthetase] adenylyltransferase / [glutamine synthetase]-adenylyl-L-tyrosine phosphorylase
MRRAGIFDTNTEAALMAAHATLLACGLDCTLDRRPRRLPPDAQIEVAREAIRVAARAQGLDFSSAL